MPKRHSQPVRGLDAIAKQDQTGGRGLFGRLFPADNDQLSPDLLEALAATMIGDGPDTDNSAVNVDEEDENRAPLSPSKALRVTAGYTYFGQFVDHDLTFDPVSSLTREIDVDALVDFRTPRFDLDSIYGSGPDDQPFLYDADGEKLLEGIGGDVLRLGQRAVIGDPRNDENRIVVQVHHLFTRLHNILVDHLPRQSKPTRFQEAQRLVRWTYQWLVVNDFLPRILNDKVLGDLLAQASGARAHELVDVLKNSFSTPDHIEVFMPVEFSGAAYRFGHSMVRPSYHLNDILAVLHDGGDNAQGGNRVPIFDLSEPNLNGFRPLSANASVPMTVEWKYFFQYGIKQGERPVITKDRTTKTQLETVQPSYKIDTMLTEPLKDLHIPHVVSGKPFSLAARNLERGMRLRLPSGQKVALALGEKPLDRQGLMLTPDGFAADDPRKEHAQNRVDALKEQNIARIEKTTPLWYYLLAEAESQENGASLGRLGSKLVGRTILGLLLADDTSYLRKEPKWTPKVGLRLPQGMDLQTMADLVALAQPETIGRLGTLWI